MSRDALSIDQSGENKEISVYIMFLFVPVLFFMKNVQSYEYEGFFLSRWQRCFGDWHCPLQKSCISSVLPEVMQFLCFYAYESGQP